MSVGKLVILGHLLINTVCHWACLSFPLFCLVSSLCLMNKILPPLSAVSHRTPGVVQFRNDKTRTLMRAGGKQCCVTVRGLGLKRPRFRSSLSQGNILVKLLLKYFTHLGETGRVAMSRMRCNSNCVDSGEIFSALGVIPALSGGLPSGGLTGLFLFHCSLRL